MTKLAFANGLVLAVQTIRSHKMRAFLTVLGVIIGTGTIIGVAAILTGFDANMTAVLRSFGPNSIIVFKFPVGFRVNNLSPEDRTRKSFAAYYYTKEAPTGWDGQVHSTIFKARPDEVLKGNIMMPLEKARRRFQEAFSGLKKKIRS